MTGAILSKGAPSHMWEAWDEGDIQGRERYFFVSIFYSFLLSSYYMCSNTLLSYLYQDSVVTAPFLHNGIKILSIVLIEAVLMPC